MFYSVSVVNDILKWEELKYEKMREIWKTQISYWQTVDNITVYILKDICLTNFIKKQPPEVFCKKGVLRNFAKFTGKHLCHRLLFNKVAGLRLTNLLKKTLWYRCFPVNFVKFLFFHRAPLMAASVYLWYA